MSATLLAEWGEDGDEPLEPASKARHQSFSTTTRTLIIDDDDEDDDLFPQEQEGRDNYRAALKWWERGYNVVPRKAVDQKHPGLKWKDLQERRVTKDELLDWHSRFANGVGFITGTISGVIVIETDGPEGKALLDEFECEHGPLPTTLVIRSGSQRGLHRHFKHPGYKVPTRANPEIKIDVKGDGGFCVLPPSMHKSGGRYEIVHDAEPAELPKELFEFIETRAARVRGETPQPHIGHRHIAKSTYERLPVNRTNVALFQSMLDALPARYASDFDLWLRTGFALHDFDGGDVGLALWKRFSTRCPEKADHTDFDRLWAGFSRDRQGDKITVGWLRAQAKAHNWRAPCRWDLSTKIESEGGMRSTS